MGEEAVEVVLGWGGGAAKQTELRVVRGDMHMHGACRS